MFIAKPTDGIAWITGASSGIGRQVAIDLAAAGFRVAVSARRADALDALAAGATGPGRILPHACDLTDIAAVRATVAAIIATEGPIALAFLNVGINSVTWRDPFNADNAWTTVEVNVRSVANALEPLIAHMRAQGRGQIVINGSLSSYMGLPGAGYYGASKAALLHLAETLRPQLAPGITVQVLNCGFVETPLTADAGFPMPFILPVEDAARRIVRGMATSRFEITFPRRLSIILKLVRLLPYGLVLPLIRLAAARLTGK